VKAGLGMPLGEVSVLGFSLVRSVVVRSRMPVFLAVEPRHLKAGEWVFQMGVKGVGGRWRRLM
jgi:hypothetical protein